MGKNTPLMLTVPEPCTQSWNEMLPKDGGRYCLNCHKKVTDFSGMTDRELIQALAKAGPGGCGRFDTTQLERTIMLPAQPSRSFLPAAALALTLAVTSDMARASNAVETSQLMCIEHGKGGPRYLEAQIRDSLTGEGLGGVTISLKGTFVGTITDPSGCFRLNMPDNYKDTPVLKISYLGYEGKEISVDSLGGFPQEIVLNKLQMELKEIAVIGYGAVKGRYTTGAIAIGVPSSIAGYSRPSFWWRVRHLFCKHPKSKVQVE